MHDWFSKTGQGGGVGVSLQLRSRIERRLPRQLPERAQPPTTWARTAPSRRRPPATARSCTAAPTRCCRAIFARAPGWTISRASCRCSPFNMNYANAYQNQRSFGGNVVGAWRSYSLNATVDHTDYFSSQTASSTSGSWPKVALTRNERLIPGTPMYFSVGGEYAQPAREQRWTPRTASATTRTSTGSTSRRRCAFPFKKWQWFTVNTTLGWRETYYSRSLSADRSASPSSRSTIPLNRPFYTLSGADRRAGVQPDLGHAGQRLRREVQAHHRAVPQHQPHVRDRQLQPDHPDRRHGHHRRRHHAVTYGLNNRFYAKRPGDAGRAEPGARNPRRRPCRRRYYTNSLRGAIRPAVFIAPTTASARSNFSPIAVHVSRHADATTSTRPRASKFDSRYLAAAPDFARAAATTGPAACRPTSAGASRATSRSSGLQRPERR